MELGMPLKKFLVVAAGGCAIVASVLWIDDRPTSLTWTLRAVATLSCLVLVATALWLHFRTDVAPDFLRALNKDYFNRDGFAFLPLAITRDGCCCLALLFQNQRDKACIGRVRIRPAPGFFLTRSDITDVVFEVFCRPGAFGRATLPIPLAARYQGTTQKFELGASVEHVEGKGQLVRFHDGIEVPIDDSLKTGALAKAIQVGAVAIGQLGRTLPKAATCRIALPTGVLEVPPATSEQVTDTFYQLGDAPLAEISLEQFT